VGLDEEEEAPALPVDLLGRADQVEVPRLELSAYPREMHNRRELLRRAAGWIYFYNLVRPHYGKGMQGKTPFEKLGELGYDLPEEFALFPPLILDRAGVDWALEGGNDLLTYYTV